MTNVARMPDRKPVNQRVGMNVKIIMMLRHVSQPRLAAELGLTQPSVSRKLNGATPWTPDEIEAAAGILSVPVSRLFEELPGLDSNQEPIGFPLGELIHADFGRAG